VQRLVRAYGDCYPNLVTHDARFPNPDLLLQRTVSGAAEVNDGVQLIIQAVDSPDPRPLWFMNWGTDAGSAPSCLKRALDQILAERGAEGYAKFKSRIRLSSDDQFGEHTSKIDPPFPLWIDTFRPPIGGKRWYHQFSAITAKAGGFDLRRDVLHDHGPLGELYPTNTTHWQKEGDSMTFLYLVPTGMSDPEKPWWGSWAGRYGRRDDAGERPYYWANQEENWQGTTQRNNTLARWAADLQNDFRARLDWCVKPFAEANHRPEVVLEGLAGEIPIIAAQAGSKVKLSAKKSRDPDGNSLLFHWEAYPEAGTYDGAITFDNPTASEVTVALEENHSGDAHVVLTVSDRGSPALASYRRIVLRVERTP
jgi:hypothetical protein